MGLEKAFTPERLVVGCSFRGKAENAALDAMVELYVLCVSSRREKRLCGQQYYCPKWESISCGPTWASARLVDPSTLAAVKHATDSIDRNSLKMARERQPRPGLSALRDSASPHQGPLHAFSCRGIYGELTLMFEQVNSGASWNIRLGVGAGRRMLAELRSGLLADLRRQHSVTLGNLNSKSEPSPAQLSARTVPPWASAMCFTMASPSPEPPLDGARATPSPLALLRALSAR